MEDRLPSRWRWMTTRGARRSGVGLILVAVVVGVYLIYLTSRPAVAAEITDCSVVGQTAVATVDVHNRSNEVQDWVLDVRFTAADHYITVYSSDLEQLRLAPDSRQTVRVVSRWVRSELLSQIQPETPQPFSLTPICELVTEEEDVD